MQRMTNVWAWEACKYCQEIRAVLPWKLCVRKPAHWPLGILFQQNWNQNLIVVSMYTVHHCLRDIWQKTPSWKTCSGMLWCLICPLYEASLKDHLLAYRMLDGHSIGGFAAYVSWWCSHSVRIWVSSQLTTVDHEFFESWCIGRNSEYPSIWGCLQDKCLPSDKTCLHLSPWLLTNSTSTWF